MGRGLTKLVAHGGFGTCCAVCEVHAVAQGAEGDLAADALVLEGSLEEEDGLEVGDGE